MDINPAEVTSVLKREIENFERGLAVESVGEVGDGVARVFGLRDCMVSEMLEFQNGVMGVALNLEEDNVGAILFGDDTKVKEGDTVRTTGRIMSGARGRGHAGPRRQRPRRARGREGPLIVAKEIRPIEAGSPNVVQRQPVREPLQTGLKAIDSMIPVGRGQRELIIGDRQTGKTAVIVDTILNQNAGPTWSASTWPSDRRCPPCRKSGAPRSTARWTTRSS